MKTRNILKQSDLLTLMPLRVGLRNGLITAMFSVRPFPTPWKYQDASRFPDVSGGRKGCIGITKMRHELYQRILLSFNLEWLRKFCKEYQSEDVWNMDENGCFFRVLPIKTDGKREKLAKCEKIKVVNGCCLLV